MDKMTDYIATLIIFILLCAITCAGTFVLLTLYEFGEWIVNRVKERIVRNGH